MRSASALFLIVALGVASLAPRPAHAVGPNVKSVMVAGGYGMLAGTALGLLTFPVTQDARTIFIGTSVGLYLGIAVGVYYILHRDDPQNPFRADLERELSPQLAAELGAQLREAELRRDTFASSGGALEMEGPRLPSGNSRPEVRLATFRF